MCASVMQKYFLEDAGGEMGFSGLPPGVLGVLVVVAQSSSSPGKVRRTKRTNNWFVKCELQNYVQETPLSGEGIVIRFVPFPSDTGR